MRSKDLFSKISLTLKNAGASAPAFEASVIFQEVTGEKYIFDKEIIISRDQENQIDSMLQRRREGYPLQYILEHWEFWGLDFKVGPGVLIPRPDTEILVETVLKKIQGIKNPVIVDLCSGSGCIAISIAKERPDSKIYAIEKSTEAYRYLTYNINYNKVTNVKPIKADVLEFDTDFEERFDLIVSNPPYIPSEEIKNLSVEVLYEPTLALDGGNDGLEFYRGILNFWLPKLKNGGGIAVEVGYNQASLVKEIFEKSGLTAINLVKDLNNIDRVVAGDLLK